MKLSTEHIERILERNSSNGHGDRRLSKYPASTTSEFVEFINDSDPLRPIYQVRCFPPGILELQYLMTLILFEHHIQVKTIGEEKCALIRLGKPFGKRPRGGFHVVIPEGLFPDLNDEVTLLVPRTSESNE